MRAPNINGHNENGQTSLICAILAGQLDAIQLLLEAGADHHICDAGRKASRLCSMRLMSRTER